jgi:DNA-directed RNA polymerase subunit RPC12/RpoP
MANDAILVCPKCGKRYSSTELNVYKCKDCKKWLSWEDVPQEKKDNLSDSLVASEKAKRPLTPHEEIIEAQNRTTYAVRSLATFLFISICTTALGYGLIGAGAGSPLACAYNGTQCGEQGLVIFGWIVIVIGFFTALGVGISQLDKSRIN